MTAEACDSGHAAVVGAVHGNGVATITLSRPEALNALDSCMVNAMRRLLAQFVADPNVIAVVLRGSTARAFCAGGDVKRLAKAVMEFQKQHDGPITDDALPDLVPETFTAEYRLILELAECTKPCAALLEGVVMGLGLGIALACRYRVATADTLAAMPENAIGLWPDVGFAHLSVLGCASSAASLYVALSGARVRAADLVHAGWATHYVPKDAMPQLSETLTASALPAGGLQAAIEAHARPTGSDVGPGPLTTMAVAIEECFGKDAGDLQEAKALLERKAAEAGAEGEWAQETLRQFASGAPASLDVTWAYYRAVHAALGKAPAVAGYGALSHAALGTLGAVMDIEYRMALRLSTRPDFGEGVRARLIDKDMSPHWAAPGSIASVFAPLPAGKELDTAVRITS